MSEIMKLAIEVAREWEQHGCMAPTLEELEAAVSAQEAEIEKLRADAVRYRYIRDVPWFCTGTPLERVISQQRNAVWDKAIDEAIAKEATK